MATGKDILIKIGGDASGFTAAARAAEQTANRSLGAIEKSSKSAGSNIQGFLSNAFSFAAGQGIFQALRASVEALSVAFVGYNAKMEQTNIAYKTMLGNADAAKVFINDMKDFAAKTPFEFNDVDRAAKKFLAMGWAAKDIIPDLTSVGNAASALGLSGEGIDRITLALGQMNIKAKLSGEEVRQLNEAGIGAQKYLADAFKLTGDAFDDLSKTGISGAQAVRAIINGMANDPKFKDMMKEQSQTMIGLWSTVKDSAGEILGAIGKQSFDAAKGIVKTFSEMAEKMVAALRAGGITQVMFDMLPPAWAERFYQLGVSGAEAFDELSAGARKAWQDFGPLLGVIWDLAVVVGKTLYEAIKITTDQIMFMIQPVIDLSNWLKEHATASDLSGAAASRASAEYLGLGEAADTAAAAVGRLSGAQKLQAGNWDNMALGLSGEKDAAAARGRAALGGHTGSGSIPGGGGGSSGAADKAATEARKVSEAIEKEWSKQTTTKLAILEKWQTDELAALEKTKAANANYERDKIRVAEVYATRKTDMLNSQAKAERELKESTVKALADIDKQVSEGYLGNGTGAAGKMADMTASRDAQYAAVDTLVSKWKEANATMSADYGSNIEAQIALDAEAAARKLAIKAKYDADYAAYEASAQAVEDELKAARDANDLVRFAQTLSDENALKLAQQQEQQTMMDMLYQWQMEAHASMTSFMLQQADQVKNSLAAGIAQSIVYGKNLGEVLTNIGKQVAAAFIEMMVKQALAATLGKTLQAAMVASTGIAAAAMAVSWAPAAYLASVATMGGASITGLEFLAAGLKASSLLVGLGNLMGGAGGSAGGIAGQAGGGGTMISPPMMASGGITSGPTYALIGEGRYQEAVIPLDRDRLASLGLGGGSGATITQNVYGDINRDVDYNTIYSDLGDAIAGAMRGA